MRKRTLLKHRKRIFLVVFGIIIIGGIFLIWRAMQSTNTQADPEIGEIVEQTATSVKKYQGIAENGAHKYSIEASIAPQRFQNEDGEWQEYDTRLVRSNGEYDYQLASSDNQAYFKNTIGNEPIVSVEKENTPLRMAPDSLYYVNDTGDEQLIAHPDQNAQAETDGNVIIYKNVYGNGLDLRFTNTNTRVVKELVINSKDALPTPTIANAYLELNMQVEKVNTVTMINPADNSEIVLSENPINIENGVHFINSSSRNLYAFPPVIARDSAEMPNQLASSPNNQDENLLFYLSTIQDPRSFIASVATPYSWLEEAVYPVMIDPTVELQAGIGANDGSVAPDIDYINNSMVYLMVGNEGLNNGPLHSWLRFTEISGLSGATINTAYLRATHYISDPEPSTRIYAEASSNPTNPTSANDYQNRTTTTSFTDWNIEETDSAEHIFSPSLVEIIQELADTLDPSSILILHKDNGSTNKFVTYFTYEYSEYYDVPTLYIEYTEPVINDPIAHWQFNESSWVNDCSTLSVIDSSGNNLHGKSCPNGTGVTSLTSGVFGSAPLFNGTDQYVEISDNPTLDPNDEITVAMWFRPDETLVNYQGVLGKGGGAAFELGYEFATVNDQFGFWINGSSNMANTTKPTNGELAHWVGTYDGSIIKLYKNGVLVDSTDYSGSIADTTLPFRIGAISSPGGNKLYAQGMFDDVRVYDRALSPSEVQALYEYNGWYDTDWSKRVKITVSSSQVAGDVTDFPVYVDLSTLPSDFHTNVNQADARDIRVTTSDGTTEVPREVVFYDSGTNTGELHFKAPTLSSTSDTDFYIYYSNSSATEPAASATYGSQNVWSNGFSTVWHLPDGSTLSATDSSENEENGTISGATATTGKLDGGGDFDGINDSITVSNLTIPTTGSLSIWWKPEENVSSSDHPIWRTARTGPDLFDLYLLNGTFYAGWYLSGNEDRITWAHGGAVTQGAWHYLTVTWTNGSTTRFYVNGEEKATTPTLNATWNTSAAITSIAKDTLGSTFTMTVLDEIKLSSVARSSQWIETEYNNQNSPAAFYDVGASEENPNVTPTPTNTPTPTSTLTPTPTPTTGPTPTPLPPGSQEMYFEGVDLEGLDIF